MAQASTSRPRREHGPIANRRFPAACFIRDADEMDHTEAPDVLHGDFGHAPLLTGPAHAVLRRAYGRGDLRALSLRRISI